MLTLCTDIGPDSNTSETTGKINDVLTEPGVKADRNVQASAEDPRYEVGSLLPVASAWFSPRFTFALIDWRWLTIADVDCQ